MSKRELDPVSGIETTGHEWNGITELDARVPKVIVGWYGISIAVAVVIVLLLPAIPLLKTFSPGLLNYSARGAVETELRSAVIRQGDWKKRMSGLSATQIAADPDLVMIAQAGGKAAFKMNCVACHGEAGRGQTGFPDLTDPAWQWGGSLEAIVETLRVGINTQHEDTRTAEMLAFGRDGLLTRGQVVQVTNYVRSLSGQSHDTAAAATGAPLFTEFCVDCHGKEGRGKTDLGAPNLTDGDWLYGGAYADIYTTVQNGRKGWMPHWSDRLDAETIKMLAVYVKSLGGGS